jgi:hypothetical protein
VQTANEAAFYVALILVLLHDHLDEKMKINILAAFLLPALLIFASVSLANSNSIVAKATVIPAKLVITIISPQNTSYDKSCIPLIFTMNKKVSWIKYSLDGKSNVTITKNTTLTGLSEGKHSIVVFAKDKFGNESKSSTVYFTIIQGVQGYVDIGKMNNQMADLQGWSKQQPKTSGGNVWGGVTDQTYWRTVSCQYCNWGNSAYAFISVGDKTKALKVELLDRSEDDSFDIYVLNFFNWVKIGHYTDQYSDSMGHNMTAEFKIPNNVNTYGFLEVKITMTGKHWSGYKTYGQLAIHKISAMGVLECNLDYDSCR